VHQLAAATGWGFREIMEEVPISAGLQIIDAQCLTQGIDRQRVKEADDFDSQSLVEDAFRKLRHVHHHKN
jgi:hypothetical protein